MLQSYPLTVVTVGGVMMASYCSVEVMVGGMIVVQVSAAVMSPTAGRLLSVIG